MEHDSELTTILSETHILAVVGIKDREGEDAYRIPKYMREHGYQISPGTMYPMLHGLARKGYLKMRQEGPGKRARRVYTITPQGRTALADARVKVQELFGEFFDSNSVS